MLTYEQLKNYYSEELIKNNPKNVLVEYLQYELLDSIFKQKGSELLSFIGGTAIRIAYGSDRFSEDLDFDNSGLTFKDFEGLTKLVTKDMELKGFSLEFRFVEKTAFHCYIKFPELLYHYNLSQLKTEKILIRIDTLPKQFKIKPILYTLNKFGVYRDILVNSPDILLAQKLIIVFSRQREKGRDFYDISFLYGFTEPNFDYIEKTLQIKKPDFIQRLLKVCGEINFNRLAREVEPFITNRDQLERVKNFKIFINQKLAGN